MCGFVGLIGVPRAAPAVAQGLMSMQHRGQDAAGVATWDSGRFRLFKDTGMVTAALPAAVVDSLWGTAGIGHVRYPTLGNPDREDAQPFLTRRPGVVMAHNGNITNLVELQDQVLEQGLHMQSKCDSEVVLLVLADELTRIRPTGHTLDDLGVALKGLMERVRGSYSVVMLLELDREMTLVGFRDPNGIRPGAYGKRDDGAWMIASETVAMDVNGFQRTGFIPPGGFVALRAGQPAVVREVLAREPAPCVFEQIYFARADAVMESGRVNAVRWALGQRLALEWKRKGLTADVVVAVPDTSRPAAMAIGEALGIPHREGFIKNRYSGRTFIMPDPAAREAALRLKLNPIDEIFTGQRVLLIDDSIVRGSTMRRILDLIRTLGPKEVHVAIFSPPVQNPCYYGIDMPSHRELFAAGLSADEVEKVLADKLGCDSLTYLSMEGLTEVTGKKICAACFTGRYPVPLSDEEATFIRTDRREG